jgi:hypothetical protein
MIMQIMMPSISFLGHLSGLLVGVLQCYGVLNWLLPSAGMTLTLLAQSHPGGFSAAHDDERTTVSSYRTC